MMNLTNTASFKVHFNSVALSLGILSKPPPRAAYEMLYTQLLSVASQWPEQKFIFYSHSHIIKFMV